MTETAACAGEDDEVADFGVGDFEGFVDGYAGAEDRSGSGWVEVLRNGSNVVDEGHDVLRERSVRGIATEFRIDAI